MIHRLYKSKVRHMAGLGTLFLTLFYAGNSYSRPDMTPLGLNIADTGSAYYHFSVKTFDSADGKRHYKVWTGIPDKTPPAGGYSVLYMLDGNAVMDKLSDPLLKKLSQHNPPVLIAIGYQTKLPFDVVARAYDYTPPDKERGSGYTLSGRGRTGGGSRLFKHLLETTIAPQAEKDLRINADKRGLWGHSYGGLFVLDAYLSTNFFTRYYSASPSLGQGYFSLLSEMEAKAKTQAGTRQLTLMEGDGDARKNRQNGAPAVLSAVSNTVNTLRADGASAAYRLYPGLSHGQMFTASLETVLLQVSTDR
ncbi:alpha/beta hydrolase-fold protein [Pantoea sp.]|uniref:alpha/beta hydrolase n=1 Tax=Pantoea sp. TaxID=69393 RepID=UPI002898487C|nr:alpha/beta hydrolase-fold protein [Pantoea sp.]